MRWRGWRSGATARHDPRVEVVVVVVIHPEASAARGPWERDPSHFPLPLSPVFASLYLSWQDAALAAMFREFGYLGGGLQSRLIDGYLYTRIVPPGGLTPPAVLLGPLMRLWWAHPLVRARVVTSSERYRSGYPAAVLDRWDHEWRPRIESELREARSHDMSSFDDAALLGHIERLLRRTAFYVRLHFVLHGAIAPEMARLEFLCRDTPALVGVRTADLVAGFSTESRAPGQGLRLLADMLRAAPPLLAEVRRLGVDAAGAAPGRIDPEFGTAFDAWMESYGHRITARYEFIEPSLAEQPGRVMALVLDLAARSPAGARPGGHTRVPAASAVPHGSDASAAAPRDVEEIERTAPARDDAVDWARDRLVDPVVRRQFDDALAAAQRAYPVRDDNVVLTFNAAFAVIRYALLETGRRWAGMWLERRDDVFFLTAAEICNGLRRGPDARGDGLSLHAAARRRTWQRRREAPPPPLYIGRQTPVPPLDALPPDAAFMTGAIIWYMRGIQSLPGGSEDPTAPASISTDAATPDREQEDARPAMREAVGRVVARGIPAVAGRHEGIARVVHGEQDFDRIEDGDVLVCPMTSPAWSAMFSRVGALVTDHGGVLSHPAVIAREFGIPAIVATRTGTRSIPDGARVVVDGGAGTVTLA